jgi:hypothetical protein
MSEQSTLTPDTDSKTALAHVTAGRVSMEDFLAWQSERESRIAAKANGKPRNGLHCKVSQKAGVSVYGLQRFPITLYAEQWERLLQFADEIRQFITQRNGELARKN